LETIFDKYRELNQAVDKLCEEIVAKDKKNKRLVFLCSFLAGVIVPLIIIVIVLLLR
jgi:predicted nucleic acid-binding Zn ribbon protein